ncbi:MAG TPA: hypothetical protein VJP85_04525 [Candidatus Baltobacteraceae bacterium]|nr:hypothetical protein [Candidatus Baltobacteraceae bacterium]
MNARFSRWDFASLALLFLVSACGGAGGSKLTPPASVGGPAAGGALATNIPKGYTLTDLGPAAGSPWLVPSAVNDHGVVVLNSSVSPLGSLPCPACTAPPQGWVYSNGTLRQLPPLGSDLESIADDVNNAGVISGGSAGATGETAVLWSPNLSVENLGSGVASPGSNAEAAAISESGKIAGFSYNATTIVPTFFDGKGGASDPCGSSVQGYFRTGAINDAGTAAGDEFLSAGGTAAMTCPPFTTVVTPSNQQWLDFGFGINDSGTVVGRLSPGPSIANFHAFMSRNGATTDLGTLFPSNSDSVSAAFGINNAGLIVGFSSQSGGTIGPPAVPPVNPRAFVYANGKMVDLNSLLPASCANWTLITAEAISGNGYIVGVGFVGGYPSGTEHAYLLTPQS